ncbi:odorant receptor 131-2-like [Eucyclogobius newberryi]|uniref:odorant receptor 131-2-like n=1 Tax=Eucyclogobius newberryi TaxID=166745 RepID=UPI003B58D0E3
MIQLSTSIFLFVLSSFHINVFLCCIIISCAAFTTQNTPLNLAVMAVERYFAVCFPLRHSNLCSVKNICILIACIWTLSLMSILPDMFYIMATHSGQLFLSNICNMNRLITNLVSIKKREVLSTVYLVGVWLVLFYTYIKIFSAAKSHKSGKSSDSKKARNTILLHSFQLLLCMLTYIYYVVLQRLVYLFPLHFIHVIFVWYLLVQVFPRCVSPILYGLRDAFFRNHLKKYLPCSICLRYE